MYGAGEIDRLCDSAKPERTNVRILSDATDRYVSAIKRSLDISEFYRSDMEVKNGGPRVLIDCANGGGYALAKAVFSTLLCGIASRIEFINDTPNGYNINLDCGAAHMGALCRAVKEGGFDIGFALDGDGDRCVAVDRNGEVLDGDMLLAILAKRMLDLGTLRPTRAVGTVVSGGALAPYLESLGITYYESDVGDRNLYEMMERKDAPIGAESAGHLIVQYIFSF